MPKETHKHIPRPTKETLMWSSSITIFPNPFSIGDIIFINQQNEKMGTKRKKRQ